jgi:uncharacterized protein (TIGR03083 family)
MPLSLDHHLSSIEADAARIRTAYDTDRDGRIPWSDRWTVRTVARHVARAHHLVAGIIHGRPTADFGLVDGIQLPPKDDPEFPAWFEAGTAALCNALRTTELDEPCWTSVPEGRIVRFWLTRMTAETLVHRWDAEVGAGLTPSPFDPAVAADGVEEYVTLVTPALRKLHRAPAGPSLRIACTDAEVSWWIQFTAEGGCTVSISSSPVGATLRGSAGGLLLALMGRQSLDEAGVAFDGDLSFLERRGELLPGA